MPSILVGSSRELHFAILDTVDFIRLNKYSWRPLHNGSTIYARRTGPNGTTILLHREIMNPPNGYDVDHKNGDGLDNRRKNLRVASFTENNRNRIAPIGYKGVSWGVYHNAWRARIMIERKEIFLGYFGNEGEAAMAYDKAATQYFGSFAVLNFA